MFCCMPYNYINPFGGCYPMAPRMDFFMGMAMFTSFFNLLKSRCVNQPIFNPAAYNTYCYNSGSIFSGGASSAVFRYNSSALPSYGTSVFAPSIQDYDPPSVVNNNNYNDESEPIRPTRGKVLDRRGNGYGKPFLDKVKQIAQRIDCDYRDLLAVMDAESGILAHKENPDPYCSATGLIQFTKTTAEQFGTSIPALIKMSPVEQLDYVEKYLVYWKNTAGFKGRLSAGNLYALVFLPGRAKNEVLTTSNEKYYHAGGNENLDFNGDGKITKSELVKSLESHYVSDSSFG